MFFIFRRELYAAVFVGLLLGLPASLALVEPSCESIGLGLVAFSSFYVCCNQCKSDDYSYLLGLANLARKYGSGFTQISLLYLLPLFLILHAYCTLLCIVGRRLGKEFTIGAWKFITEAPQPEMSEQPLAA